MLQARRLFPVLAALCAAPAAACHGDIVEACACAVPGHGARVCDRRGEACGACACLAPAPVPADPVWATTFYVDPDFAGAGEGSAAAPWREVDWPAVDAALATGDTAVYFSGREADAAAGPESYDDQMRVLRTDQGPARLLLDGRARYNADDAVPDWRDGDAATRARVPGVTTTEEHVKRSRVTLRGFELVDTVNQGVSWEAGDDVVLEDLIVHRNGRSPAIHFEYASRSGLPSTNIVIRNNHVFDIRGECIYVGGADQMDLDAHVGVTIENNLVHGCGLDGINVKDRITDVVVRRNVIFDAEWGLQMDSGALIDGNLIFDTTDSGIMLGDGWGGSYSTTRIVDDVLLRNDKAGVYVGADRVPTDGIAFEHITIADTAGSAVVLAGYAGVAATLEAVLMTGGVHAFDGWGSVTLDVGACGLSGNETNDAGSAAGASAPCVEVTPEYGGLATPAGPDGLYFTADDGWRSAAAAVLTGATDGTELGARIP